MRATILTSLEKATALKLAGRIRIQARAVVTGLEAELVDVGGGDRLTNDRATVELDIDLNSLIMEEAE